MANNVLYGYLAFHGKDSKVKYPIRKRKITIGSARDCDLRLKKEPSNRQFVQLSIKQSSQNGWDYKLDICAFAKIVRENITIDDQKVFLDSISIQLKDGNVISIFGENFTFLQGKRLTSKIPVLKKNQLLNLYSTNSCGWSSKSNAKNSPFRIGSASRSKIPISDTSKLIDFDHSPVVKLKESTVNNDMIDNDEIMTEIDHDQSSKHDETFEVDPEKSALLKFSTPSPQMKIVVAKSLKSLLKTTPQLSTTPNRKSVVFNEFVEENHSEYDRRTGQLFSTKKLSRKLFPISSPDHQQTLSEQDELDSFLQHFCDEIDSAIASSTMANNDSTLRFYTVNESIMADDDQSQSEHSTIIGHHYVDKEPDQHDTWYDVDLDAEKPDTPVKPVDDYTENSLQQQPTTPMAEHDSNVDDSLPQPTTPKADYVTNIDFAVKKLQQPTTPIADYESNVDYGIKKLQQPTTPKADYETNMDFAIKKLQQPTTPMADYETNVDYGIKKLQQPTTPKADYVTNVDFGIKRLQECTTPLAEYDANVSGFENLFFVEDANMMTPVKPKGRGRRPRQQVQIMDDSNNRILTRSAVKNKINNEEKVDKSTKNKKQSTGNKRRRKVDKDEIGLLVDDVNSEDDESKVDIEKIRELAETNVANQSNVDQFQKRSRRSRKQSSTTDDHRLQDFMELDDDQLIDAMDETPITGKKTTTSKTKNATRKRKTTTIVNDSSTTKQRTNKTSKSNDNPEDYDENSFAEQENRKNVANCPKDQKKCRITLPEVDFSMRLECNDSREPKSKGVVTRSRAKRIK